MSWYLDENDILCHENIPDGIDSDLISPDYTASPPMYGMPALYYHMETGGPVLNNDYTGTLLIDPIVDASQGRNDEEIMTPPYPASYWYLDDNDILNLSVLPNPIAVGAFARTKKLREIRLPMSLISIGRESFAESGIRKVTIPNENCTYYSTSFPENCEVTGGTLIEE